MVTARGAFRRPYATTADPGHLALTDYFAKATYTHHAGTDLARTLDVTAFAEVRLHA